MYKSVAELEKKISLSLSLRGSISLLNVLDLPLCHLKKITCMITSLMISEKFDTLNST
jgi:hypothetical protein